MMLVFFAMVMAVYAFLSQGHPVIAAPPLFFLVLTLLPIQASQFTSDWFEGRLEQWVAEGSSLERLVLQKIVLALIKVGLPLLGLLVLTFMSIGLAFPLSWVWSLIAAMVTWIGLGTLLGSLLLGHQRSVLLSAVILFPLMVPQIILSLGVYEQLCLGKIMRGLLLLQGGLSCVSLALSLLFTPAILRWSVR